MLDWLKKNLKGILSLLFVTALIAVMGVMYYVLPGETYTVSYTAVNNASPHSMPVCIGHGSAPRDIDPDAEVLDTLRPGQSETHTAQAKFIDGSTSHSFDFYAADEKGRVLSRVTYRAMAKYSSITIVWDGNSLSIK